MGAEGGSFWARSDVLIACVRNLLLINQFYNLNWTCNQVGYMALHLNWTLMKPIGTIDTISIFVDNKHDPTVR